MTDEELRKWCLERAFECRDLAKVYHMAVTNVAEEYYEWIKHGVSDRSKMLWAIPKAESPATAPDTHRGADLDEHGVPTSPEDRYEARTR